MIISHLLNCDWRPLKGFSVFEFGADINDYLAGGTVLRPDCPNEVDLRNGAHGLYRPDRLKCSVREANGVIDEIAPPWLASSKALTWWDCTWMTRVRNWRAARLIGSPPMQHALALETSGG